ncbi:MAG: glycerate kinase [Candidatus Obscuribacterales bacterium]|nr:glycerate kinase [Candidatus Obscuribacterales bacterium]
MRILVAPTAYKGTFSPAQIAVAMARGIEDFARSTGKTMSVDLLPIADGGDGTVESLSISANAMMREYAVLGSCNEKRIAFWVELKDCAVVELASACGIAGLQKSDLNPLAAHTRGLGEVLRHVLETSHLTEIIVALGGSASTDGGCGVLLELGGKFFDRDGFEFRPTGGIDLMRIEKCDLSVARELVGGKTIRIATDVENPLLGEDGAAYVFAPQKGASLEQVKILDEALEKFANLIESTNHVSVRHVRGAGAAGGTAFGLAAGLGAEIISGFDWISRSLALDEKIRDTDLVFTGEGRVDKSSLQGKVVGSLRNLCTQFQKPLWIMAASLSSDIDAESLGIDLIKGIAAENSMANEQDISRVVCETLQEHF